MTQFKNDLAFILRIVHCGYRVSFGNSFRGGIFRELVGRNIVKMAIILPTGQWYAPSAVHSVILSYTLLYSALLCFTLLYSA